MNSLKGKTVLITGASSGIGWETAIAFSQKGAHVIGVARNAEKLEELKPLLKGEGGQHLLFPADVTQEPMMRMLLAEIEEKYGKLDILIANAGVGYLAPVEKMKMETLRKVFETNFFSVVSLTQLALPLLKKSKGHIIPISSVIGRVSLPHYSAYCASKFALEAFAESLRPEVKKDGIRVSVFCPPLVRTNFSQNAFREDDSKEQWKKPFEPDLIANKIVKLAEQPKRDWVFSLGGKLLVWLHRWCPKFLDNTLEKHICK